MKVIKTYDRQVSIFDPNQEENQWNILIVGAGTIGSWVTLALTKLGLQKIHLVDFDKVESHNISNQVPGYKYIGSFKALAMKEICEQELSTITPHVRKFPSDNIEDKFPMRPLIVISAVDSMESRKQIWNWVNNQVPAINYFIDGRMGGQVIKVYSFNPLQISQYLEYEKTLHSDKIETENKEVREASEVPCTARSIVDVSMIIAGVIVNHTRKAIVGQENHIRFEVIADMNNELTFTR